MNNILNLSYPELIQAIELLGEKSFRATQIFEWIYQKNVWSFDDMKNISKDLRDKLSKDYILKPFKIATKQVSEDGTTKFLFDLDDGEKIETVLIPTATRTTVCVSTQVGCKFGCKFCASGVGGWNRNLSAGEILTQIMHVKQESLKHQKPLSHIVFMGLGEPLDNYDSLMRAIRVINAPEGLHIAARRITISTCGVVPRILQLAEEGLQVELAVSLHGFSDTSRNVLMPVNKKWNVIELMDALRAFQRQTKRQITFEYILIQDVTCTERAARELGKLLRGLICKMNLIPYNPVKEFDHQPPPPPRKDVFQFQEALARQGVHATVRMPRGRDVDAACGQLRRRDQTESVA